MGHPRFVITTCRGYQLVIKDGINDYIHIYLIHAAEFFWREQQTLNFLLNLKIHCDVHKKYPNDPYTEPNKSRPHCHAFRIHFSIILLLNLLHVGSWNFKTQISCPLSIALDHQKECTRKSEALHNILQYVSLFNHMRLLKSPPNPIFI
jgi:hypothetical protein